MKKSFKLLWSIFITLLILSFSSGVFAATTVNLIVTNDMHGVLEGSQTAIGISQVSAIKNSTENALLIDSGDATQGTTLATINKGNDIIKLMNAAGYDCMVAGNHEFDYGSEQLLKNAETADFPILSANAVTANGTLLPATHIQTVAGKKIGFVGITTTITNTATNPELRPGVTFSNEITAAKQAIASLKGQVDTIVLLTHLGDNSDVVPVTSKQLLDGLDSSELSQVSAVLDGHSHTIESEPYTRDGFSIPLIQDQTQLTHVGKVSLTFNDDGTISGTEQVMDYDTAFAYEITQAGSGAYINTSDAIRQIKEEQSTITNQIIGSTNSPLWGGYIYWDYAEPRIVETSFSDMATDAFKNAAQEYADDNNLDSEVIGLINGGGVGSTINPGTITYGDILNAFNHGNMMVVLQTTPAQLYNVIEKGLSNISGQNENGMLTRETVSGSFIQVSGITLTYNPSAEAGSKVVSITTSKGTSLSRDDNTTPIIVGTQNYVQTFFENPTLLSTVGGEDTVISDYVQGRTIEYPSNQLNRIQIANDTSPDTYTVTIPVYDSDNEETQKTQPNITVHLKIDNGAAQTLQTDNNGNLVVTVPKGAHTLTLNEANKPVYINNYSGSGTEYTKPGYYGLSFVVANSSSIPATDITLSTDSIDLSPQYGSNTATVTATVSPADTTDGLIWSIGDNNIANISTNKNVATITGVEEGRTYVLVTCGEINKLITVIVSNDPIVATSYYVESTNPDYFTVIAEDVHANRDISSGVQVNQVSMFTWSDPLQNDIDCKVVSPTPGTNDYSYTFPINGNRNNTFYFNANDIAVDIYASSQAGDNGNLIGVLNYDYANTETMPTNLGLTAYCSNLGFLQPTFNNNMMAAAPYLSQNLEGIRIGTSDPGVILIYSVHVRDIGWLPSQLEGGYAGTMHVSKPIEAVRIDMIGENAGNYSLTYQTIAADNSTSKICTNGEVAGSTGRALPLKGLQVSLQPK